MECRAILGDFKVTDFTKSLFLKLLQLVRYQAALHPDCPIHREKITANQALTKVFYNDYEFKSRKPTLIKKIQL